MSKVRLVAAAAVLMLVPTACGDSGTTPSGTGTTPGSPSPSASPINIHETKDVSSMSGLTVEIDDFYFNPTFMKATPGQKINLELENEGSATHSFTISSLGIDEELAAGAKKEIDVTVPAGGGADLQFICRFHVGEGMRGAFFFGAAPQTTAGTGTSATDTNDGY